MRLFRCFLVLAIVVAITGVSTLSVRADANGDLRAFVQQGSTMTFASFAPLHGKQIRTGDWVAKGTFGPSLTHCLVVDLPPLDSLFDTPSPNEQPYSSTLQCDGARVATTQAAMVARAVKIISAVVPGFTMKRYPTSKSNGRTSVTWKNATGLTISFIAMGKGDYKDHDASRLGYTVEAEQLSPSTMATASPSP
jgi:hypothetical protein